ncbi:hypothetical protein C0991_002494 [Blastosporella zonata]|nr:hypothetical protein C0991_002494 [Blastosporella zonata]
MSSGSEPCAASTAAGGPPSSSAGRPNPHINLVITTPTPSRSPFSSVMGQSFAKAPTSPTGLPPSPPATPRSFSAAMAGGLRLTRAFAGRRKKSEDVTKIMDRSVSQGDVSSASHTQRIEATASISSSPAQVSYKIWRRQLHVLKIEQLATQVLKKAAKTPQRQQQQLPPPQPPPKPLHVSPQPEPPSRPPQLTSSADYRSSIIPISPGISSAVKYLRMEGEREQDVAPAPRREAKGKQQEEEYKAERRKDAIVVEQGPDADKGNALDKGEMKDAWRKSDSTMSYHTIRPGGQPSRPVSMAESLQSNHTVVPVKRQSALITDADFGMVEEDDDSEASVEDEPVPQSHTVDSPNTVAVKARERRAMSMTLNHPAIAMMNKLPPTPSSASAANMTFSDRAGASSSPLGTYSRGTTASMRTATNAQGYIAPSSFHGGASTDNHIRTHLASYSTQPHLAPGRTNTHALSASRIPIQHPRTGPHNPYTTFPPPPEPPQPQPARPSSRLDRSLPSLPPHTQPQQPRQPTLSMSGGFGLAKRAVEKMGFGRALGLGSSGASPSSSSHHGHKQQASGYSSSSSSHTNHSNANTPPSSYGAHSHEASSKLAHSYDGLAAPRTSTSSNSGQSSHGSGGSGSGGSYLNKKNRSKHTAGAPSVSSTASDSDAMEAPTGPNFGKRLRGPLRRGGGGVFGRDLRSVVRETAVGVGKPKGWGGKWRNWDSTTSLSGGEEEYDGDKERGKHQEGPRTRKASVRRGQLRALEERKLPALVVRCAQHLLIWGIQEEGVFRIPGRALHVTKLRAEFDSGADFDMTECSPGDLDPHSVASVFKAFLRELPEPILTSSLSPYFEAAMAQESSTNASKDAEAGTNSQQLRAGSRGPGLPSGPRNTGALPPMRKAPSLTTLAMPNMTGIRPPSKQLIGAFQTLLAQLPEENRDLIRTVSELIRAVAHDSRETKMPLSNLLLVFCPSLNMSPPLLRVLCEAEEIWEVPEPEHEEEDDIIVLDIRKQGEEEEEESFDDAQEDEDEQSMERASEDVQSSLGYNASTEDVSYAPSMSSASRQEDHGLKASGAPSLNDGSSYISTSEDYGNSSRLYSDVHSQSISPPPLSSSAESLDTPATSHHDHDSLPQLPTFNEEGSKGPQHRTSPVIAENAPRRPIISNPVLIEAPIQFPSIAANAPALPSKLGKRRSIPIISLPNFNFKASSSSSDPDSPNSFLASRLMMKKPSLQLLFQKKSSSSLSSPKGSPAQSLRPAISSPYLQARSASDSSVSTPLSAVTAPQASTATLPKFPAKLETSVEGSLLSFDAGKDVQVVETPAIPKAESEPEDHEKEPVKRPAVVMSHPLPAPSMAGHTFSPASASSTSLVVRPGSTPIADRYRATSPSPSLVLGPSTSQLSLVTPREYTSSPALSHLRLNPTSRSRGFSTSSRASSNHLGLLDEDVEQEDWTKSVLLAADVDIQGPRSRT